MKCANCKKEFSEDELDEYDWCENCGEEARQDDENLEIDTALGK